MRLPVPSVIAAAIAGVCIASLGIASASAQTIERVRLTDNDLTCGQIYSDVQQMETTIKLAGSTTFNAPAAPAAPSAYPAAIPAQPLSAVQQAVLNHPNNANLSAEQKATLIAQTGMAEARGNAAVGSLYGGAVPQNNFAFQGAVMADPNVRASITRARAAGMSDAQIAATLGVGMQQAGLPQLAAPAAPPAPVSAGQAYAQAGGLAGMLGAGMSAQGGMGGNAGTAAGIAGLFGAIAGGMQRPTAAPAVAPAAMPVTVPQAASRPAGGNLAAQAQARKDHLTTLFLSRGCKLADVQK